VGDYATARAYLGREIYRTSGVSAIQLRVACHRRAVDYGLGLHVRYKGSYGRLGTAGVLVILVGYALLFVGSILAILLYLNCLRGLIMAGQYLGFLGTLIAGVSATLYGMAFWRARAASGLGALPLIIALPVGIAGMILVSAIGCVDIAGLQLTDLYGDTWVILGSQLRPQGGRQPTRVS
jgi:hypothetical protein